MRVVLSGLSAVGGAILLIVGAAAAKWYFWDTLIREAGQADRSMLFWGIPILFIGMVVAAIGVGLVVVAIRGFRSRP